MTTSGDKHDPVPLEEDEEAAARLRKSPVPEGGA
jgi:hypothetical protein